MPKEPSAFTPSHAQPLPNRPAAAALNFSFMASMLPNALSMAACRDKGAKDPAGANVCATVCVCACVSCYILSAWYTQHCPPNYKLHRREAVTTAY